MASNRPGEPGGPSDFEALIDTGPPPAPTPPVARAAGPSDIEAPHAEPHAEALRAEVRHTLDRLIALVETQIREAPGGAANILELESRVRQTMDRLTELVEAQLPEAVDGLRGELEHLKGNMASGLAGANAELSAGLAKASAELAEERQQLRTQITSTVAAANLWFVRTRDQLYERLDMIAEAVAEAQARAEEAEERAKAAATEAASAAGEAASLAAAAPPAIGPAFEWDVEMEDDEEDEEEDEGDEGDEDEVEVEVEDEFERPAPPRLEPPRFTPEVVAPPPPSAGDVHAAMAPLRADIQDLQVEISAMGQALLQLRDDVERLRGRIPATPRRVTLDPREIDAIVDAVREAVPKAAPRAAVRKAPAAKAPTAARGALAKAAAVKKLEAAKKAATARRGATATKARRPER